MFPQRGKLQQPGEVSKDRKRENGKTGKRDSRIHPPASKNAELGIKLWRAALTEDEVQLAMNGKLGAAVSPSNALPITWGNIKSSR